MPRDGMHIVTPTEEGFGRDELRAKSNHAKFSWVCAILDDGGLWHHLRGITRRETSGTL
jgi:hypothetical protein